MSSIKDHGTNPGISDLAQSNPHLQMYTFCSNQIFLKFFFGGVEEVIQFIYLFIIFSGGTGDCTQDLVHVNVKHTLYH